MADYLRTIGTRETPQTEPIIGSTQVPNSAGGFAWAVDDWTRLHRFLVLGSEGGSYYASERALTLENAACVLRCIEADGPRAVLLAVEISQSGRAPKNDPAIFVLAVAQAKGNAKTREVVDSTLHLVCRTGTHLFAFVAYVRQFRGWSRSLRRLVGSWYLRQDGNDLAYQAVKYQQRNGWSHRDLLRLSHPQPHEFDTNRVLRWITHGTDARTGVQQDLLPPLLWAFEEAKHQEAGSAEALRLIVDHRLPREALPTEWLTDPKTWEALLPNMGMTALLRNLATMTRVGLLTDNSNATRFVLEQLRNEERLRGARVHPIQVLSALLTYKSGHGMRSSTEWTPVERIVQALDEAYHLSFGWVEPAGKRTLLALDVSGSMGMGTIAGVPGLVPFDAAAAMAMVTVRTEPSCEVVAFASGSASESRRWLQGSVFGSMPWERGSGITPVPITADTPLTQAMEIVRGFAFGGTDCALPMLWALGMRRQFDTFVVFTDSETWAGKIHPAQALRQYRQAMGINAKLVVVGCTANEFSIADPADAGMLDVVGFDTATPNLISEFSRGMSEFSIMSPPTEQDA